MLRFTSRGYTGREPRLLEGKGRKKPKEYQKKKPKWQKPINSRKGFVVVIWFLFRFFFVFLLGVP